MRTQHRRHAAPDILGGGASKSVLDGTQIVKAAHFSRAKGFGDFSVELDALEPNHLRRIVEAAIHRHLPERQYRVLIEAEKSERLALWNFVEAA